MYVYPNYYEKVHNYIKNFSLIEYKIFFAWIYWIYKKWLEKILCFLKTMINHAL